MSDFSSKGIREQFLAYFEKNGHKRMRSSSLVPLDDPTLLFTNAGMNQFKDVFTGKIKPPAPSATTSQKCMRVSGKHNDLENVGRTARHHTFFEMLGNFSFMDYFKVDAIRLAWELMTEVYKLDPDRLWVSVFREDDEANDIWIRDAGMPQERVVRMDEKDNFWTMGDTGPCGPCSEILYDRGEGPGGVWKDEDIYGDSDRFIELWNLVFMQYERHEDGKITPLPKPSVDTGGGLERFVAVKQGVFSNYETDLFLPIITKAGEMCCRKYHADDGDDMSLQIIADHVRAMTFLIGDGVLPSNEFRGYVLRRVMRRAIRHGKHLGFDRVFMPDLCDTVISEMGAVYPELTRNRDFILNVVREEEKSFRRTLNSGLEILNEEIARLEKSDKKLIPGAVVFKLYDTYGFPVDLTENIAAEHERGIDRKGFDKAMEGQRERGRLSWKGCQDDKMDKLYCEALNQLDREVKFTGYESEEGRGTVKAIFASGKRIKEAPQGMDVEIVVDETPFYAESGGQVGDQGLMAVGALPDIPIGEIVKKAGLGMAVDFPGDIGIVVLDTTKHIEGLVIHKGRVLKGALAEGRELELFVDRQRRARIRANHSATHLLQYALRKVLGDHVKQSGSWVGPDRLRFDFTHFQAIDRKQLEEIECVVNEKIIQNIEVDTHEKSLEQAQKEGAIAFFGEKYGDQVRVVGISQDSVELCGGTHAKRMGEIGSFKIGSESSIASGIRRIEAFTGMESLKYSQNLAAAITRSAASLSVAPEQVPDAIQSLFEQQRADRKRIEELQKEKARLESASLLDKIEEINGVRVLCAAVKEMEPKAFRDYGEQVMNELGRGIVLLAATGGPKVAFLLAVSEEFREKYPAGKTIGRIAAAAGGKGGGRPDMAQAGGGDPERVEEAFEKLKEIISSQ